MFLTFRRSSFSTYFNFTAAGVVPCGDRKTSPRTSSQCRLYIFWSFGTIGLILSHFKNRVPLKQVLVGVGSVAPLLHMNRLNKTESAILFLSCVLCFQRIFIQILFRMTPVSFVKDTESYEVCPARVTVLVVH